MSVAVPAAAATQFPWAAVLTTVIGSGVLAASVQAVISGFAANRERFRQGRDTALRAAAALEEFARAASNTASSAKYFDVHVDDGPPLASIPDAPDTTALDWKSVPQDLAARAFGFKQVVAIAEGHIAEYFDHDDDQGLDEHFQQAIRLGLMAWALASDLRSEFKLTPPDIRIANFDFLTWMREEQTRLDKEAEEIREIAADL